MKKIFQTIEQCSFWENYEKYEKTSIHQKDINLVTTEERMNYSMSVPNYDTKKFS